MEKTTPSALRRVLLAVVLAALAPWAAAQDYPARPVRIIVPFAAGGPADVYARIVGEKLQAALGQPFVIDNRPGAGGSIGSDVVAKSTPDGYTLLAASAGPISIMPNLQKIPYDPLKDFAPVSLIALVPFVLVTNPSFPATDLKGFIANVRANPGKYSFSSSGTAASAYMVTALFNSMAQLDAQHVPYKGTGPAITDIIGGQVTYTIETVAATVGHVRAGRLRAYGVSFAQRASAMPDVPTIAEAAPLPGYDIGAWIGYTAPAGTPREALARLAAEMQKIAQSPDIKERYLSLGLDPISSTPDEMAVFLRQQQERYGSIIKAQGIKVE
jgi:tripartite-type tricarboxylate transporter receptor subunit TctC